MRYCVKDKSAADSAPLVRSNLSHSLNQHLASDYARRPARSITRLIWSASPGTSKTSQYLWSLEHPSRGKFGCRLHSTVARTGTILAVFQGICEQRSAQLMPLNKYDKIIEFWTSLEDIHRNEKCQFIKWLPRTFSFVQRLKRSQNDAVTTLGNVFPLSISEASSSMPEFWDREKYSSVWGRIIYWQWARLHELLGQKYKVHLELRNIYPLMLKKYFV